LELLVPILLIITSQVVVEVAHGLLVMDLQVVSVVLVVVDVVLF
tara:strand:- start:164 stop:295 length:132 start_codon:yes stop_codon:yes gene_type:complete